MFHIRIALQECLHQYCNLCSVNSLFCINSVVLGSSSFNRESPIQYEKTALATTPGSSFFSSTYLVQCSENSLNATTVSVSTDFSSDSDRTSPVYSYERLYSRGTLSQFEGKLIRKGAVRSTVASEQDRLCYGIDRIL